MKNQKTLFRLSALAIGLFLGIKSYEQATPPVIQWQYTNTPQYAPRPDEFSSSFGENWFYDITSATDGSGDFFAAGYSEVNRGTISNPIATKEPIIVRLSSTGALIWENIFDGGVPDDDGYFWRVVQTTDASHELVVVGLKDNATYKNVFAVQVDPATGNAITGPVFYGNVSGHIQSGATPQTPALTAFGEYLGLRAIYDATSTLKGFIVATKEANATLGGLLSLNPNLSINTPFGNNGYQTYQYLTYNVKASDVEVIGNGTNSISFAMTG